MRFPAVKSLPPKFRAACWVSGSLTSFVAMAIAGRELGGQIGVPQILLVRSLFGLAVTGALLATMGGRGMRIGRFGFKVVVLRNITHFGATWCWFTALTLLPLATVFAFEFTMPIWASILAALFLGERLGPRRVFGIFLGFAGILTILSPDIGGFGYGMAVALMAAIGFAIAFVTTKRVIGSMPVVVFLFYMSLLQMPLGLLTMGGDWVMPDSTTLPWLAVTSAGGLTAHFCLGRALKLAQASAVAPMDFARLPLIAVAGALLYGETLAVWVGLGAALICLGNWLNLRGESKPRAETS